MPPQPPIDLSNLDSAMEQTAVLAGQNGYSAEDTAKLLQLSNVMVSALIFKQFASYPILKGVLKQMIDQEIGIYPHSALIKGKPMDFYIDNIIDGLGSEIGATLSVLETDIQKNNFTHNVQLYLQWRN